MFGPWRHVRPRCAAAFGVLRSQLGYMPLEPQWAARLQMTQAVSHLSLEDPKWLCLIADFRGRIVFKNRWTKVTRNSNYVKLFTSCFNLDMMKPIYAWRVLPFCGLVAVPLLQVPQLRKKLGRMPWKEHFIAHTSRTCSICKCMQYAKKYPAHINCLFYNLLL